MRAKTRNTCLLAVALLLAVNQAALAGSFQPGNILTAPNVHFDKTNGYVVRIGNVSEDTTGVQVTLYDANGKTLKSVHRSLAAHALWSANLRDWSKSIGTGDDPALGDYMIFAGDQAVLIGGGFSLGPEGPTGGSFVSSSECDRCKTFWVFWSGGGGFHTDLVVYSQPSLTGSNAVRVTPYDDTGSQGDSVTIDNPPTTSVYDVANLVAGTFNGGDRTSGTLKVELPAAGGEVRVRIFAPSGKAEEEKGWCDLPPADPTPPSPSAAACKSFAATPASIVSGDHATLSWSVSNAQSGSIDQGVGSIAVPSGFTVVSPAGPTKYTLTVQGNDGSAISCSANVDVTPPGNQCTALTLTGPSTASGKVGTPFSLSLQSSGTLSANSLPPGLALNGSTISGTPTTQGTYTAHVIANSPGACAPIDLKIVISIDPAPPPTCSAGNPSLTVPSTAKGKVGNSFSLTLTVSNADTLTAGNLPPGLSLSGNVISGTPTSEGVYDVAVVAANQCGNVNRHITITIEHCDQPPPGPCTKPSLSAKSSASGKVGTAFSLAIQVSDGATLSASDLPPGLSLNGNVISGTPTQEGDYDVKVTATNSCDKASLHIAIKVEHCDQPPTCTKPSLYAKSSASGKVGSPFSLEIQVSDGASLSASSLPPGLSLKDNVVSGTPTQEGSFDVTVTATNSCDKASLHITIKVEHCDQPPTCTKPTVYGKSSALGKVGSMFSLDLQVSDGATVSASNLPPGLEIDGGKIYGTPTKEGSYDVQVTAKNSCGEAGLHITITVDKCDTPPTPPDCKEPYAHVPDKVSCKVGKDFYLDLKVTGTMPLEYSPKDLPEGIELDTDNNQLKGSPHKKGSYTAVIRAHNACGKFNQKIEFDVKGENEDDGGGNN